MTTQAEHKGMEARASEIDELKRQFRREHRDRIRRFAEDAVRVAQEHPKAAGRLWLMLDRLIGHELAGYIPDWHGDAEQYRPGITYLCQCKDELHIIAEAHDGWDLYNWKSPIPDHI